MNFCLLDCLQNLQNEITVYSVYIDISHEIKLSYAPFTIFNNQILIKETHFQNKMILF